MTVKLTEPAVGGVPVSKPAVLSVSHEGSPVAVQPYVPVPPVAVNCSEYGEPAVAAGSGDVVVMASVVLPGFTGSVKRVLAWLAAVSVTVTVKLTEPTVGGVPVNNPAALSVSHEGSPVAVQLYVPVPPVAMSCSEYGVANVAAGRGDVVVIVSVVLAGLTGRV